MNDTDIEKIARKNAFRDNNGSVIRIINLIRTDFVKLATVKNALAPKVELADVLDCINYLQEAEYIKCRVIGTTRSSTLADSNFDELEAKLTAKGIQLINGAIDDPCINL